MRWFLALAVAVYIMGLFWAGNVPVRLGWTGLPIVLGLVWWWLRGRDRRYKSDQIFYTPGDTNIRQVGLFERSRLPLVYAPIQNLSPAEIGTIADDQVHFRDLVAELLELSRLGYLRIADVENDVLLIREEISDKDLRPYQKYLLNSLFMVGMYSPGPELLEKYFGGVGQALNMAKKCVALSKMKGELRSYFDTFADLVYRWVYEKGWFDITRGDIKHIYTAGFSGAGMFVLMALFAEQDFPATEWWWIGLSVAAILGCTLILARMPAKTAEGYRIWQQIKGLKYYLNMGKWRYEIAEKNLFLEEIFPICVALGIVNNLSSQIQKIALGSKYRGLYSQFME